MKKGSKFIGFLLFMLLFLGGCQSEPQHTDVANYFPSDTVLVENKYPPLVDSSVLSAIQILNICSLSDTNTILEPCDHSKFRVFPLGPEIPFNKGFILEMKEGVYSAPFKQVLVIEKSFNKYKIINRYYGFLIEYRTTESGYNDILMGYKDPEIGLIALRHSWKGESYDPVNVEEINGYFIKPELQDSINNIFISTFSAGY
ncbi:MAG: hypothetical protein AB8B72_08105 [Crocinitomicaceae bacterium]